MKPGDRSPRPEEPDIHLEVQFDSVRLYFAACLTAAMVFICDVNTRRPGTVTVTSGRSIAAILGAASSMGVIIGLQFIPVAMVMDWMYARRLLYVKVGGRDGFADLRFPGLRQHGYTSGVVKRLTTQVFGGRTRGTAVSDGDLLALRRAMSAWENTPMPSRR